MPNTPETTGTAKPTEPAAIKPAENTNGTSSKATSGPGKPAEKPDDNGPTAKTGTAKIAEQDNWKARTEPTDAVKGMERAAVRNLTVRLNVVDMEQAGIHPKAGYYLVLLKQVGNGRVFHTVLQPGQRSAESNAVKRFFTERPHKIVSIPVTADRNLHHIFTSVVQHVSPGHAFEIDYSMTFAVSSPELVATGWALDPVRQVEEEIKRELDVAPQLMPWDALRQRVLNNGDMKIFREDELQDLQIFAESRGLSLISIQRKIRLSRADAQPEIETAEFATKKNTVLNNTDFEQVKMEAEHKLKMQAARDRAELRHVQQPEELRDKGYEVLGRVAEQIGAGIHRTEDARHAIQDLGVTLVLPGTRAANLQAGLDTDRNSGAPVIDMPTVKNAVVSIVTDLAAVLETMGGDPGRKRELMAAMLHLIAEAYLGTRADADNLQKYVKAAGNLVAADWDGHLSITEFKTLNKLADLAVLRELLK